jgi:hypothetical protein
MTIRARELMALIQDIADGMSYAQISQTHGIRTEQIPRFASTWGEKDFGREEGIRDNRHMELMFEVTELRAEIAKSWPSRESFDVDTGLNVNPGQRLIGIPLIGSGTLQGRCSPIGATPPTGCEGHSQQCPHQPLEQLVLLFETVTPRLMEAATAAANASVQ